MTDFVTRATLLLVMHYTALPCIYLIDHFTSFYFDRKQWSNVHFLSLGFSVSSYERRAAIGEGRLVRLRSQGMAVGIQLLHGMYMGTLERTESLGMRSD